MEELQLVAGPLQDVHWLGWIKRSNGEGWSECRDNSVLPTALLAGLHVAACQLHLDGVVSFHGNLATEAPAQKGAVKGKLLVLHGAEDPLVPPEQVTAFKKEMDVAEVDYVFVEYPGAKHAFTDPAATEKGQKHKMPLQYDEKADEQSWAEMSKFLEELFPPG